MEDADLRKALERAVQTPAVSVLTVVAMITDELLAAGLLSPRLLRQQLRRGALRLSGADSHTRATLLTFAKALRRHPERSRKAKRVR